MGSIDTEQREALDAAAGGAAKRAYVRRMFSEIAPRYDLLNHLLSFNIDRGWRRRAIAALQWERRPAGAFLDVCAGTMDVAVQLAAERGFRGTVIAADFAEPMVRRGAEKARGTAVRAMVADALTLPLADATADGAIVAFGVRNFDDLDAGLRELHRVIAPGARLVILECSAPRFRLAQPAFQLYFHRVLPFIGRIVSGHPTAYRYFPESVANFPVPADLARRMERAGFVRVGFRPLTMGIVAVHWGERGA